MTDQWGAVPPPSDYPPLDYPPPPYPVSPTAYPPARVRHSTREFDTFGPWVTEVTSPEDLPRLFSTYPIDFASARLVLKVPRDIARRDAHPGMDLYDHLLIVHDDTFTVLTRLEGQRQAQGGFTQAVIRIADIAAISDSVDLLDGRLSILALDGSVFAVRYNGSARATVEQLVDCLRGLRAAAPAPGSYGAALLQSSAGLIPGYPVLAHGRDDVILLHDFQELAKTRPELRAWMSHGGMRLGAGIGPLVAPHTMSGMLMASDGASLEVIARREAVSRVRTADHSHGRTTVPLDAITAIREIQHERWPMLVTMTLVLGAAQVHLVVPEASLAHRVLASAMGGGWR